MQSNCCVTAIQYGIPSSPELNIASVHNFIIVSHFEVHLEEMDCVRFPFLAIILEMLIDKPNLEPPFRHTGDAD